MKIYKEIVMYFAWGAFFAFWLAFRLIKSYMLRRLEESGDPFGIRSLFFTQFLYFRNVDEKGKKFVIIIFNLTWILPSLGLLIFLFTWNN